MVQFSFFEFQKDLFGREIIYERVNVDQQFPEYIVNNKDKFSEWII